MLKPADQYFDHLEEPNRSCMQFLRERILSKFGLTENWQYGMPFFTSKGKRICYLWVHKKLKQPYLGIVEGKLIEYPGLIRENRARMKIFLIDPMKDIPLLDIDRLLKLALATTLSQ